VCRYRVKAILSEFFFPLCVSQNYFAGLRVKELSLFFLSSMIYCAYLFVLINTLNNCKILIAHMDAIIMSLIYYHICSIDPLAHYNIIYYVATLYCEQL